MPIERVLGDALAGDQTLFAREDYIEEAWRIVDAAIKGASAIHEYAPGSWGPAEADALITRDGGGQSLGQRDGFSHCDRGWRAGGGRMRGTAQPRQSRTQARAGRGLSDIATGATIAALPQRHQHQAVAWNHQVQFAAHDFLFRRSGQQRCRLERLQLLRGGIAR